MTHGMCTKIDYILGNKTNYNKFKIIEIIQSVVSDHPGIKLDTNSKKITGKPPTTWKLKNTFETMGQRGSLKANKKYIELSKN